MMHTEPKIMVLEQQCSSTIRPKTWWWSSVNISLLWHSVYLIVIVSGEEKNGNVGSNLHSLSDKTGLLCPNTCVCSDNLKRIECINMNRRNMYDIPSNVEILKITSGDLRYITPKTISHFHNLHTLSLEFTNVQGLYQHTFSNLLYLQHLSLSNNHLHLFDSKLFQNVSTLTTLRLDHNAIEDLLRDTRTHKTVTNLKELSLSHNKIRRVPGQIFKPYGKLLLLDLSYNKLQMLNNASFYGLSSLRHLNISHNELGRSEILSAWPFSPLTSLQTLNLNHNHLEEFPQLKVDALKVLRLSNNLISSLADNVFNNLAALEELYLDGNPLSTLSQSLTPLHQLTTLSLVGAHHLRLSSDMFKGMHSLKYLNLSAALDNIATNMSHQFAFPHLPQLEVVDVSNNNLTSVSSSCFTNLPNLKYLHLQGNAWHCDCSTLAWLAHFPAAHITLLQFSCKTPHTFYNIDATRIYEEILNCNNRSQPSGGHHTVAMTKVSNSVVLQCLPDLFHESIVEWRYIPTDTTYHLQRTNFTQNLELLPILHVLETKDSSYLDLKHADRIDVLPTGDLYIAYTLRSDAGLYECTRYSAEVNTTSSVFLRLNYDIILQVKTMGSLLGFCAALVFLLFSMFMTCVTDRSMRRCKPHDEDEKVTKAQQLRQMLVDLEAYHQQQVYRVRKHYAGQLHKLRDHCFMQTTRISDNYASQVDKMKNYKDDKIGSLRHYRNTKLGALRDYRASKRDAWRDYKDSWRDYYDAKIDAWRDYKDSWRGYKDSKIDGLRDVRDNYGNLVARLRDCAGQQYLKAHENYQLQILRVREYCAQQLKKVAITYKLKQKHILALTNNLHIMESCRMTNRTESIIFEPDFSLETLIGHLPGNLEFVDVSLVELPPELGDEESQSGTSSDKYGDCDTESQESSNRVLHYTQAEMANDRVSDMDVDFVSAASELSEGENASFNAEILCHSSDESCSVYNDSCSVYNDSVCHAPHTGDSETSRPLVENTNSNNAIL